MGNLLTNTVSPGRRNEYATIDPRNDDYNEPTFDRRAQYQSLDKAVNKEFDLRKIISERKPNVKMD